MIDPINDPAARARARTASSLFAAALFVLTLLVAAWHWSGCAATAVRRQAQAADVVARAFNNVGRPALVTAYETACRDAIINECEEPPCPRDPMLAALRACDARWQPMFGAYEVAVVAHATWRATILRCAETPDGGTCSVDLARDSATLLDAVRGYRCAVRGLGRPELDPVPGQIVCEVRDGGRSD